MNEITKEKVATAVIKAVEDEKLLYKEACELFHTIPLYFTYLRNQKYWDVIPGKVWEKFHTWMYSGKKLKEYKIPESYEEEQQEFHETAEEPTKSHVIEPVIRAKVGVKEARMKVMEERDQEPTKGRSWITNGIQETRINRGDLIPEGWKIGRKPLKKYKSSTGLESVATLTNKDYAEAAPEQSLEQKEAPAPVKNLRANKKPGVLKTIVLEEQKKILAGEKLKGKAEEPVTKDKKGVKEIDQFMKDILSGKINPDGILVIEGQERKEDDCISKIISLEIEVKVRIKK